MKKLLTLLALFIAIFLPLKDASAAQIFTDTEINLNNTTNYSENIYVGAARTMIESTILGDLMVVSGESNISGKIDGDVLLLGAKNNFQGEVTGDLRVISGEANISGKIDGDILILGGDVNINQAKIAGQVIVIGGNLNLDSEILKQTKIIAGRVFINNKISGPIEITTQNLTFGGSAIVSNKLSYFSPQTLEQNQGAQISGEVTFNKIQNFRDMSVVKQAILNVTSFWLLLKFITTLIISFGLVYVFKVFATETTMLALRSFPKTILAGILLIILSPFVVTLLFISLAGMPIGVMLILVLIFMAILAQSVAGIFIGSWIKKIINKSGEYAVDFQGATIGVVALAAVDFVPVLGDFVLALAFIVSLGAMTRYAHKSILGKK